MIANFFLFVVFLSNDFSAHQSRTDSLYKTKPTVDLSQNQILQTTLNNLWWNVQKFLREILSSDEKNWLRKNGKKKIPCDSLIYHVIYCEYSCE